MFVREINLADFRSFKELHAEFGEKLNFISGANAAGKTNLIESIYYLSLARSFKKAKDTDLIRAGAKRGQILLKYNSLTDGDHSLEADIMPDGKIISFDGEKQNSVVKIIGKLLCVVYSPLTVSLFRGEPAERRRFMDATLSLMYPKYLYALTRQKKLLKQRNTALNLPYDEDVLRVLTDELIAISYDVYICRCAFVKQINQIIGGYYQKLFASEDEVKIVYQTDVPDEESQEVFIQKLKAHFDKVRSDEQSRSMTLLGVQKDDILAYLGGKEVYAYASQGQNRLVVLALSLASREIMEKHFKEKPVLLLDDVLSDLDEVRQQTLLSFLQDQGQVFLTSAQPMPINFSATAFEMTDSAIKRR